MTSTSFTAQTTAMTNTEFELAYTLRSMEEVLSEFRNSVTTKFAQNGVLTPTDDQPFMERIIDTMLDFRTVLSPEAMAVLTSERVESEVQDTLEEAEQAIEFENLMGEFLGGVLEALGIDQAEFQGLVDHFQEVASGVRNG